MARLNFRYLAIIIFLSLAVYANTFNNGFVSDDIAGIVKNPTIAYIRPSQGLVGLSYTLNYRAQGLNPFIYHLTNTILHALNSALVFLFLCLFFTPWQSFWAGLIFAVHPAHTEAVAWISARGYLLSAAFLLISLILYSQCLSSGKFKKGFFLGSVFSYALCLNTSSFAFVFPALFVLYDLSFRNWRRCWKLWIPYLALTMIKYLSITPAVKARIIEVGIDSGSQKFTNPLFNAAYSLTQYLRLLILPDNLTIYHEPNIVSAKILALEVVLLISIILFLPLIFKKERRLFFAAGFFIISLAPTYSPIAISWLVAERYLYLASLSFSIAAAVIIGRMSKRIKILIYPALIILITAYSVTAIVRNLDWKTHGSIWRATVYVSPYSPKAHNNMGDVYSLEGNLAKAAEEFKKAIALKPDYADAYHNLGLTYQQMGDLDAAIANYKRALSLNPLLYQSYQNLGVIYLHKGNKDLAQEYFNKALEIKSKLRGQTG